MISHILHFIYVTYIYICVCVLYIYIYIYILYIYIISSVLDPEEIWGQHFQLGVDLPQNEQNLFVLFALLCTYLATSF